ncbi:putative carbohydrate esterase [Zea mays]|uniref:Putative carbohydrate esterase n=2 Tax=Zea mays TaxID=4577 RepID=K7UGV6_MAIZE|nr:probable carbohydrate esterase At4g34215 [Zea mays]AQK42259.1 putative carbohydrate esterase [Zea mays]PWZ44059.1 putative carbohydrate esterase [Zea mays]|eukprot:XP_023156987.1 probable carbohydrate esterase At4g34215 [Zea mays]
MKPAARRPLLLCALAAAAALSILLVAPPPLAAHLSSLLLAFPASPYAGGPKLVVLLAGQSNMAGRGLAPSLLPPQFRPHPRVLRLAASRRWVVAAPPLHADIDTHKACGLGPAMPFAHRLLHAASPDLVLGLVPCAVGGTRIWMWAKGEPLYEAAVARGRAAVAAGGGTLGAVLWFQGESDTIELDDATAYGGRMERLVNDFRADLGMPNLLVIQVGLASGEGNYTDIVREAQRNIKLPNVVLVDAIGLPLRDDQLHLSTEAQLRLGDMLGQAFLKFNSSMDSRQ